uniref:Mitochondrial import receptor subunit TOM22 homolog n=1 Tax=Catagonus wagneri TaxID=51154 RepID=A0A8C3W718_9CETA
MVAVAEPGCVGYLIRDPAVGKAHRGLGRGPWPHPFLPPNPYDPSGSLDSRTLGQYWWGLTGMFLERLSLFMAQKMYRFSRAALWIRATSFVILVLPVVFETEKLQMEQQQQLQQWQVLLGPNTGLSGGMPGTVTPPLAIPPLSLNYS